MRIDEKKFDFDYPSGYYGIYMNNTKLDSASSTNGELSIGGNVWKNKGPNLVEKGFTIIPVFPSDGSSICMDPSLR